MLIAWSQFLVVGLAIWLAGARLSRAGDALAEKTGLTRSWVGLILLSTATSLPELATGLSAAGLTRAPDIALGDALGSCVFNLLIFAFLDVFHSPGSIYSRASQGHILSAGFGVALLGVVVLGILLGERGVAMAIGPLGAASLVIVGLYLIAIRTVFRYERRQRLAYSEAVAEQYAGLSTRQVVAGYATAAAVVVAAGIWLPFAGARVAAAMGWEHTFVGTLFLAAATSTPEMAVTVAAARLGAVDLAIANLLGSNLFDVLVVACDDLVYPPGPLLAEASTLHAISAATAMTMSGLIVIALLYRPEERSRFGIPWVSVAVIGLYALNMAVLWWFA